MENRYRTLTLSLMGAERTFLRTLTFRADMSGDELLDRLCIALGRFPTAGTLLRVGDTYHGRAAHHFKNEQLRDDYISGPLPYELQEAEFILDRADGWIFRVEFIEDQSPPHFLHPETHPPVYLRDNVPLLPDPRMRLPEYNAMTMAQAGLHLPPDLERMIIVDALPGLMIPEVGDIETAMELYTVLREQGRQTELATYLRFLAGVPEMEIIFELLRLATSESPPRITKAGFLTVHTVRNLVEKFPALCPPPDWQYDHHRSHYPARVREARDATTLTNIIDAAQRAGLLEIRPGESLRATDYGRRVLEGPRGTYPELASRILRAWTLTPASAVPDQPTARRTLTFREYVDSQTPRERPVDEDVYARSRRPRQPDGFGVYPVPDLVTTEPPF